MGVVKDRIAGAVADPVRRGFMNRQRRRCPEITGGIVAQKDTVARRVAHRIVMPRRDTIKEAVRRPRSATPALAHDETSYGVPDHVDPGRRREVTSRQMDLIFTGGVEATQPIEALQTR